jgi:hypothetical protein
MQTVAHRQFDMSTIRVIATRETGASSFGELA